MGIFKKELRHEKGTSAVLRSTVEILLRILQKKVIDRVRQVWYSFQAFVGKINVANHCTLKTEDRRQYVSRIEPTSDACTQKEQT